MKLAAAVKAFEAISALNEGDKKSGYVFAIPTRLKLSSNLRLLRPFIHEYLEKKTELVKHLGFELVSGNQLVVKAGKEAEFATQNGQMLAMEVEIKLQKLTQAELGTNQIPIEVLADLQDSELLETA